MDDSGWGTDLDSLGDPNAEEIKVRAEKDGGVNNCYTFLIKSEDHTLGNLLTQQLLKEDRVLFAGYRIKHPLNDYIYLRVNVSNLVTYPTELVETPIRDIVGEIDRLSSEFDRQVDRISKQKTHETRESYY